jgi:hypothetical protein
MCGDVHKNAIFKCQPSTPMQAFASMRSTPLIEIDDKGEVGTKICQCTKREVWREIEQRYHEKMCLDMKMDKEGATLKK